MKSRWANLWEVPQAISFLMRNFDKNHFDHRVMTYPTTKIVRAENGDSKATSYMPVHTGVILESMGWAEGLDAREKLESAVVMVNQVSQEAEAVGYREMFFISSDERTDTAAEKLGFEKVTCYRKRL